MKDKIQTICAATGWYAKYKIKGEFCFSPLACWALTKSGKIEGLLVDGKDREYSAEGKFFIEYIHEKMLDDPKS